MSIAEKFEIIADAVYEKGISGRDELIYNVVTDNERRINYHNAFQYSNWTGYEFIKPIKPTGYISNMFYSCNNMTSLPTPLDFSEAFTADNYVESYTYRTSVFAYCRNLEFVPDLNMKALGGIEQWFRQCRELHTIELLRVKRETIYTNTFSECSALTNITFEGEIGQSISFKDSPLLSIESQINIIKHLVDFSGTDDAGTRILTIHANAWEKLNQTYSSPIEVGISFYGSWI